jgi:hypothetical protein
MIWAVLLGLFFALASLRRFRVMVLFGYADLSIFLAPLAQAKTASRSLYASFARTVRPPAITLAQALATRLGASAMGFEVGRFVFQVALAALTAFLLGRLASGTTLGGLLAVTLLLGGNFAETGWYMRANFTSTVTTGLLGLAFGALVLTLFLLSGGSPLAFAGAGLLAVLHPVHGLLTAGMLLAIMAAGAVPAGFSQVLWGAALFALCAMPVAALPARMRKAEANREEPARDDALWWRWMAGRTRNMFALAGLDARGGGGGWKTLTSPPMLVFALGAMSLYAGSQVLGLPLSEATKNGLGQVLPAGLAVFVCGLAGFAAQLAVSDLLRIRSLASLCLARATAYGPFFFTALWAATAQAGLAGGGLFSAAAVALALASLGQTYLRDNCWMTFFSFIPPLLCLPSPSGAVLALGLAAALLGTAGFAATRPRFLAAPARWVRPTHRLLRFVRLNARDSLQLGCLGAACWLGLLHQLTGGRLGAGDWRPAVLIWAVLLGLRYVGRSWSYRTGLAPHWADVQLWAAKHAAPGSLFVVPPACSGFEILSGMSCYMDSSLFMYALYMPSLTGELRRRTLDLGVDPDKVGPMRLNPDLIAAYRRLGEADFLGFAPRRGVEYVIVESEHFRRMSWPTMPVVHANPEFVALRVPLAAPGASPADDSASRTILPSEAGS